MKPKYTTIQVANFFIEHAKKRGESLTPMKLQKLMYFAQGWHLALTDGAPLFNEQIEAWKFGPVIPSIYRCFKQYGSSEISEPAGEFVGHHWNYPDIPEEDSETRQFLEKIYDVYAKYSASRLSAMTHIKDAPWDKVVKIYGGEFDNVPDGTDIPIEYLKEHFKKVAERNRANASAAAQ